MKEKKVENNKILKKKHIKENIIIFITMALLLTLALLSLYPGIMSIDGNNQWHQVETNTITNNHPFFSTFFWWLLSKVWAQPTCLCVFQILLLSVVWTYICNELNSKGGLKRKLIYTVIVCLIPIIFAYAITAWKDIIYSYMLLLLALMFYIGVKKDFKYSYPNLLVISICLVWITSYRYNGVIVLGLSLITFLIIFLKKKLGWKKILSSVAMFVVIFTMCKIPEKVMCKPQEAQAGNDIMLFIMASLVKNDKITDPNDLAIVNEVYQVDKLKEEYNPFVINSLAFSDYYNRDVYAEKNKEMMKIFIKYSIRHPFTIARHYLRADNLLIGMTRRDAENGYVYIYPFSYWETKYSGNFDEKMSPILPHGYNFYLGLINFGAKTKLFEIFYMPGNILYLSIICMIIYCARIKDKRYFLVLLPMIFNTISLLPINVAQDLRYVYINYLTFILMVIPMMLFTNWNKKEKRKASTKNNNKKSKPLIIVPAYNEGQNIEKTVNDIKKNTNYDYIIVNDCSKDNTKEVCDKNNFNVISLPVNYGLTSGIQVGMKYAYKNGYDVAIQFDGDGQHQAKYIKDLIEKIDNEDCDIVIGSRFVNEKKPISARMLGSNIIEFAIKLVTGETIKDPTSGMRAYNRKAIEEFVSNNSLTPEPDTLVYMMKKDMKVEEVQVQMSEREFGESYLNAFKSVEYMLSMMFSIIFVRALTKDKKKGEK